MTTTDSSRQYRRLTLVLVAISLLTVGCYKPAPQTIDTRYNTHHAKVRLLFDLAHAHPQILGGHLDKDSYGYYEVTNWHSLLNTLRIVEVSTDLLVKGEITSALLDDYQLFCLFFPEKPAPPLTIGEIHAIEKWVRDGGGLFIVGEHNNAGYSSERLNPLLSKFGIEMGYGCVVDDANAFTTGGWHKCFDFTNHPIIENVRAVAVRTGGALEINESHPDEPRGIVRSSKTAYLDHWNPNFPPAFTGDFVRQPQEPEGPFFEMAVATPGKGRVVVLGDHNIFDNLTLRYVDNLRCALQAWNWLAREKLNIAVAENEKTILVPETTRPSDIMRPDSSREGHGANTFYTFFTVLNRHPTAIAHCTEFLDDKNYSMVIVAPQRQKFSSRYLEYLRSEYQEGAVITVLADAGIGLGDGTKQVLQEFEVSLGPLPKEKLRKQGELIAGDLSVGRGTVDVYPWHQRKEQRTLLKLLTKEREYPIIVEYAPRIQIVLQAQMFYNRAFQTSEGFTLPREIVKPNEDGLVVFRAIWAWLDTL